MSEGTMRLRELGGAITHAKEVFVYVPYADITTKEAAEGQEEEIEEKGMYLRVNKVQARDVLKDAKEAGLEEVTARWDGRVGSELLIGG